MFCCNRFVFSLFHGSVFLLQNMFHQELEKQIEDMKKSQLKVADNTAVHSVIHNSHRQRKGHPANEAATHDSSDSSDS